MSPEATQALIAAIAIVLNIVIVIYHTWRSRRRTERQELREFKYDLFNRLVMDNVEYAFKYAGQLREIVEELAIQANHQQGTARLSRDAIDTALDKVQTARYTFESTHSWQIAAYSPEAYKRIATLITELNDKIEKMVSSFETHELEIHFVSEQRDRVLPDAMRKFFDGFVRVLHDFAPTSVDSGNKSV